MFFIDALKHVVGIIGIPFDWIFEKIHDANQNTLLVIIILQLGAIADRMSNKNHD